MQTHQFTCPHCRNLMAVGPELLGQQVQCPTCLGVVVAPAPPSEPLINFDEPAGRKECEESIFGEHHDEDLFGSRRPKVELPSESESITTPIVEPQPQSHFSVTPPVESGPTAETTMESPPRDFAITAAPAAPVMAPAHWPTASAEEPEPAPADWTKSETDSPAWAPAMADDQPGERIEVRRRGPTLEQKKGSSLLLAILGPYSVVMTIVAGYYFFQSKWGNYDSQHPLANIPDAAALFDPPTRKQLTKRLDYMPKVDAELPDSLIVRLGGTIRIGDLEVVPERISRGEITVHTITQDNVRTVNRLPGEALLLHLRVKNNSRDVAFCPTDPVFDRYYEERRNVSKPYNQVVVGKQRFYGGAIDVLSINWNQIRRKYIEGQDNDDRPLPPGEQRQTIISTDPQDVKLLDAIQSYSGPDPLVWRVQLRRGLTEFNGREYPVCAVIGVQFTRADIPSRN